MANQVDVKKAQDKQTMGKYFRGVKSEFKKVVWPTKKDVVNYSVIVLVAVIIFSIVLSALDYGVEKLFELFIR